MAELSIDELKRKFRNGTLVKEQHFIDLIDSFVHKSSGRVNGTAMPQVSGITPKEKRYLTFYQDGLHQQKDLPSFTFEQLPGNHAGHEGMAVTMPDKTGDRNLLTFKSLPDQSGSKTGRIGVNTTNPLVDLDVNGCVGMKSRVGRFRDPAVDPRQITADGRWHRLLTNLKGVSVLEVVLACYCPKGRHAVYYGILTNAFGKGSRVKPLQQSYSRWWHRLQLRWTDTGHGQYGLEVRTASRYQTQPVIYNRITNLWN
jgi:hypothetical protein